MKQLEPSTRGDIGHVDAEFFDLELADKHPLTNTIGVVVRVTHLEKLEAVKLVSDGFDGADRNEKIMYFMADGGVKSNC